MNRKQRTFVLVLLPLAGIALGALLSGDLSPARAGGICKAMGNTFITSNEAGDVIYEWRTFGETPHVVRYDYATGKAVRKTLEFVEAGGKDAASPDKTKEEPAEEIVISGVIWVADPEKRVAIINGKTYREGEIFVTRTGRRYRVTEIKRSDEVVYKELKGEKEKEKD